MKSGTVYFEQEYRVFLGVGDGPIRIAFREGTDHAVTLALTRDEAEKLRRSLGLTVRDHDRQETKRNATPLTDAGRKALRVGDSVIAHGDRPDDPDNWDEYTVGSGPWRDGRGECVIKLAGICFGYPLTRVTHLIRKGV